MSGDSHTRAGTCAILGLPNAGKSTLMNRVLGMRLCAVSTKPQTTRNRVLGIKTVSVGDDRCQMILVDTPGAQLGDNALRRYMRDETLVAAGDCDLAVLMIDAADPGQADPNALASAADKVLRAMHSAMRGPVLLALNKVDKVAKPKLLPILEAWSRTERYQQLIPISALEGDGVRELEQEIARLLPEGPFLYPEDMITDRAERFVAAELIREQLFRQLGQELPYSTAVIIDEFHERADKGDVTIMASIFVERDSQKGIVVGKGGQRIKTLGEAGRMAVSEMLGCPVHLKLHVKVSDNWSRDGRGLRKMGYE